MRFMRPLRLLIPFVAIAAALALFLGVGFIAFNIGGGGGGGGATTSGPCDAGLRSPVGPLAGGQAGTRIGDLSAEQRQNAATIIGVAREMGAPPRAWLVALATAMQESTLRNINYGDRDSLGLFQQRPSAGWGTAAQVQDPVYAAGTFYDHLVGIPGWETGRLTEVAQSVQRSGFPEAYEQWGDMAEKLAAAQISELPDQISCVPDGSAAS
jgi:hypothetical protein